MKVHSVVVRRTDADQMDQAQHKEPERETTTHLVTEIRRSKLDSGHFNATESRRTVSLMKNDWI